MDATISIEEWTEKSEFEDHLPAMAENLGAITLLEELCKGFGLLADNQRGVITCESLKQNAAALGLEEFSDTELIGMIREGDLDGDGALDELEFCVLMFRLTPELMTESRRIFNEAFCYDEFASDFPMFLF